MSSVPEQLNLRIIGNMGLILLAALGNDFTATHKWRKFVCQTILANMVIRQSTHMESKPSMLSERYLFVDVGYLALMSISSLKSVKKDPAF